MALLGLGAAFYLIWAAGVIADTTQSMRERLLGFTLQMGLRLEHVYIDGLDNVDTEEILQVVPKAVTHYPLKAGEGLQAYDIPLYAISLPALKEQIERLGWIYAAQVERQLPNSLLITVRERIPRALWKHENDLYVIDASGTVLGVNDLRGYTSLPVIVGSNVLDHVQSLMRFAYKYPEIGQLIESISWVNGRRWNVGLSGNITVLLPEQEPAAAWERLYALHREQSLLDRAIAQVDLRDSERLYIELTEEARKFLKKREEAEKKD